MGRLFLVDLDGPTFKCKYCSVDLAHEDDYIHQFGPEGEILFTYWFHKLVNVILADTEEYHPDYDFHGVEISCVQCLHFLGWKHMRYGDQTQEEANLEFNGLGRYYLDRVHVLQPDGTAWN